MLHLQRHLSSFVVYHCSHSSEQRIPHSFAAPKLQSSSSVTIST